MATNNERSDWRDTLAADVEHRAMNIVFQIGDVLYEALPPDVAHEHFVKARQATNDLSIDFAQKLISGLLASQRTALLAEVESLKGKYAWAADHTEGIAQNDSYNEAISDVLSRLQGGEDK